MVAKYFAELCIAMFLTGIEIQTPADFISKSTIIILQNFCLPTYLFFALQIIYQRHDIFGFYSRKPAVAAPVGSGGGGALRLVERGVGAAGRSCGALACENGIVRAGILIGYPEKVTIFAR